MNKNAKKWVAKLRSGEYQQAKGRLHQKTESGPTFCCLGVACELYVAEHPEFPVTPDLSGKSNCYGYDGESALLPDAVIYWLGLLKDDGAYFTENGGRQTLTENNDSGMSFTEIADLIESEPSGLFYAGGS